MSIELPDFVALDPGLYYIPVAQVWVRPWIKDNTGKLVKDADGDWIYVGDCDEVKTSFTVTRQSRYARDQRVRTKVVDRVTQVEMGFSFKAMQHSGLVRAMSMFDVLTGRTGAAASTLINIGIVSQYDLEVIVENVGEQGPEGKFLFHRAQIAPEGDLMLGGSEDFVGADFKGSVTSVPGLGLGVFAPKGVLLPGEVAPTP